MKLIYLFTLAALITSAPNFANASGTEVCGKVKVGSPCDEDYCALTLTSEIDGVTKARQLFFRGYAVNTRDEARHVGVIDQYNRPIYFCAVAELMAPYGNSLDIQEISFENLK